MTSLLDVLAKWRPFTAVVVGDFMLDQLVYGDAERLSPDAPVPVLRVRETQEQPGGAANVCLDLAAMRGRVIPLGVTGDDAEGRLLRNALAAQGLESDGLIADPARPTTVKRSLVGLAQHRHPQKMFRLDMESKTPVEGEVEAALLSRFESALAEADVICIEDYGKGVCTEAICQAVIERARRAGKPILVDPASLEDFSRYRGATAITPNRSEAELVTGRSAGEAPMDAAPLARALLERLACEAVVVTLDRHGALLAERDGAGEIAIRHEPTLARNVYDVTGAGDMVLASLAAARANGASWAHAVAMANVAAGLEVEVFGVQPMPLERIHQAALAQASALRGKARSLGEAQVEVAAHRREGKRIVFTNGCFDLLHAGHISLLRQARSYGDVLVVGVNDDASVARLKGDGRPVHALADRLDVLSELESVDIVTAFSEDTPLGLIEALRPDVLIKGADYTVETVVGADLVRSWGGRVELVELLEGRSSTEAISRLRRSAAT